MKKMEYKNRYGDNISSHPIMKVIYYGKVTLVIVDTQKMKMMRLPW